MLHEAELPAVFVSKVSHQVGNGLDKNGTDGTNKANDLLTKTTSTNGLVTTTHT